MTDISKKVMNKIKQDNLEPRSRGYYTVKKVLPWLMVSLSVLMGIVASSVAIFQVTHSDWDLYHLTEYSALQFLLIMLPYFWLVFLGLSLVLAYLSFRRTDRGYRAVAYLIIVIMILASCGGGLILYQTGFSGRLENVFQETIPFYHNMSGGRSRLWMAPEKGLLAGEITGTPPGNIVEFRDLEGRDWLVNVQDALWKGWLTPQVGLRIKIIGEKTADHQFKATEIRRLNGRFRDQAEKHRGRGFRRYRQR